MDAAHEIHLTGVGRSNIREYDTGLRTERAGLQTEKTLEAFMHDSLVGYRHTFAGPTIPLSVRTAERLEIGWTRAIAMGIGVWPRWFG